MEPEVDVFDECPECGMIMNAEELEFNICDACAMEKEEAEYENEED
jgi:hypothetical protein